MQQVIDELAPANGEVIRVRAIGGGCISTAWEVRVQEAGGEIQSLFVKQNEPSFADNFACEADGLRRLGEPGIIAVPKPRAVGTSGEQAWLVLDWVEAGSQGSAFFSRFGRDLATLHRATRGTRMGLDRDNYLGAARQPNQPRSRWVEFVAQQRLGFQLRWAGDQGLVDRALERDLKAIIRQLDDLLSGRADETCLLHGDLWSGNYLADRNGQPVILDPAVYYGCREAEFGMLKLFGSCPMTFDDAYQSTWPLASGWQRRTQVYVLYHLLNHLNLFGAGYQSQCRSVAAKILRGAD